MSENKLLIDAIWTTFESVMLDSTKSPFYNEYHDGVNPIHFELKYKREDRETWDLGLTKEWKVFAQHFNQEYKIILYDWQKLIACSIVMLFKHNERTPMDPP